MSLEITDFDKRVYNMWLSSVRKHSNKPFRKRVNFNDFENHKSFPFLKKLSHLFIKTPHLFRYEFFDAPYFVDKTRKYYDLKYYSSFKAISNFSSYISKLENDPNNILSNILNSFKFIYNFCLEKNLRLSDYAFYKSIAYNDCLKHIKDHYVSPYIIFCIPELHSLIVNLEDDIYKLYYGDMNLEELQKIYENNDEMIKLCNSLKQKISTKLLERLKIK